MKQYILLLVLPFSLKRRVRFRNIRKECPTSSWLCERSRTLGDRPCWPILQCWDKWRRPRSLGIRRQFRDSANKRYDILPIVATMDHTNRQDNCSKRGYKGWTRHHKSDWERASGDYALCDEYFGLIYGAGGGCFPGSGGYCSIFTQWERAALYVLEYRLSECWWCCQSLWPWQLSWRFLLYQCQLGLQSGSELLSMVFQLFLYSAEPFSGVRIRVFYPMGRKLLRQLFGRTWSSICRRILQEQHWTEDNTFEFLHGLGRDKLGAL